MKGIIHIREHDVMRPFTTQQPLALLPVVGREVLSYALKALDGHISDWHIIAPETYTQALSTYIREAFPTLQVSISSEEGTTLKTGKYLILQGNALYAPDDLLELIAKKESTLLVKDEKLEGAAKLYLENGNILTSASDSKADPFFSTGACVLHLLENTVFSTLENILQEQNVHEIHHAKGYFFLLLYPWHLLEVQKYFLEKADLAYFVHPTAQIHATAYVGANVVIGAGVVVEEEAELQDVCLFPGVRIGAYSRVHASVLADNVMVEPDTIVDGSSQGKSLMISEKLKKIPSYTGVFVAPDQNLHGFYTETSFIE